MVVCASRCRQAVYCNTASMHASNWHHAVQRAVCGDTMLLISESVYLVQMDVICPLVCQVCLLVVAFWLPACRVHLLTGLPLVRWCMRHQRCSLSANIGTQQQRPKLSTSSSNSSNRSRSTRSSRTTSHSRRQSTSRYGAVLVPDGVALVVASRPGGACHIAGLPPLL